MTHSRWWNQHGRTHEPLCANGDLAPQCDEYHCLCDLIARVRESERAAALLDAVEAIKMQTVALWSHPRDGTERTAIWLDDGIAAIQALREKQ